MIKPIQTNEIFNTPFTSNKSWSLNSSSSIQTVEEGYFVSSSYNFYETDERNSNGTYKRLVYQLVKNSYYNPNIAQNFGLETTDSDKVVKILQNSCIRITLPRIYFGDSILRDSVSVTDYSKDKVYTFYDDTYGNLYVDGTHFINYVDVTSNVYSKPTVNFTGTPLSGFAPLSVTLTPIVQGNATEFLWDLGDGNTSTSSTAFTYVYVDAGTYTVSLTVTGFGGTSTKTRTNYVVANAVIPAPTVDFSFTPPDGYTPLSVTFTSNTTNVDYYTWDFGDGTTSNSVNPTKTYSTPGIYTVSLTGTGGGGTRTTTKTNCIEVVAIPLPSPNFIATPNTGYATITSIQFTDGTTVSNDSYPVTAWTWDFGDSTSSTLQNPTKTYSTAGTYTVSLTTTNAGGSATHTKTGYVTVSAVTVPVANFTIDKSSGDIPLSVTFDDTSTGIGTLTYSWDLDDGTGLQTTQEPVPNPYDFTVKGSYDVTLTVSNTGGSDSETKTIIASDPADRLDYSPSTQLMNWSTDGGNVPTNPNITLTDFKKFIDTTNIKGIIINSTVNPITTISNTNYYTSLDRLEISNQSLTSISGIGVTNLKYLFLDNNSSLSSVTINDLPNLQIISLTGDDLSGTVNLSSRTPLTILSVADNDITTLNVTGNTGLTTLYTYANANLTAITGLNTCTAVNLLQVWNCDLRGTGATPFNISALTNLITLQISGNPNLAALDVTNNVLLRYLFCQDDGISTIDLTNNPELLTLWINGNNLSTLDLTNNTKLTSLKIYQNTSLGLPTGFSGLTQLQYIDTYNCNITVSLNYTPFTELKTVIGGNTALPSVNLSTCTKLEWINITNSPSVTTLNLPTTLSNTTIVRASGCGLTAAAVNDVLVKLDANGKSNPTPSPTSIDYIVNLTGGTNAAPTGAGITAKNNLIAKGWNVTTN